MERTPVRYAVLRDRRVWNGLDGRLDLSGLQPEGDGVLTLARVPGVADGPAITHPPSYDVAPSGLAAGRYDDLYIARTNDHSVLWIMGRCGEHKVTAGRGPGTGPDNLNFPRGMAIAADRLYVADTSNARVVVFRLPSLERHAIWKGALQQPTAVAADSHDRIYVVDRGLDRVLRFDADGTPDTAYNNAMAQHAAVMVPVAIAVGGDDVLFVADDKQDRVLSFDANGHLAASLSTPGAPTLPHALAASGTRLYAADAATGWIAVHQAGQGWVGTLPHYRGPVSAMIVDAAGRLHIKPGLDDAHETLVGDAAYVANAVLIGGPFDAGDLSEWERVTVDVELPAGTSAELRIYTAPPSALDPSTPAAQPTAADWTDLKSLAASLDTLVRPPAAPGQAPQPSGRYLWLRIALSTDDPHLSPGLQQVRAATTGESHLDRLPAVYAREDGPDRFLARWLALFRADLGDWDQALDDIARRFDPAMAPEDALPSLARWLAFTLPPDKDAEEWRRLLEDVHRFYRRRGTPFGIAELCQLYTGVRPHLIEAFHDRQLWRLGDPASGLGFDTMLAPAVPDGMIVPGFTYADPAYMGLRGDYYSGTNFEQLKLSRIDDWVNFNWELGSPVPGLIGSDEFSIRWTGQVQPRFSELYTFRTASDDGVRLWVNGRLLIDDWHDHGRTENSGQIALTAGRWYPITLEYYDLVWTSSVSLSWSSRSQNSEIIPRDRLYALVDEGARLRARTGLAAPDEMLVGQAVVGDSGPLPAADFGTPLFGETAHLFTVLVPASKLPTLAQRDQLKQLIEAEKPAHTDFHLCFIEPRMRVGFQARVGIDAIVAGDAEPMVLGETALGLDSVLGDVEGHTHG